MRLGLIVRRSVFGATLGSAALLASVREAKAEDPRPSDRAFVEVVATPARPFVGEPFELRLRLGFDAAYFETSAAPLFRRPVDVPVEVTAPWTSELADAVALPELPRDASASKRLSFSLEGHEASGSIQVPVTREGRAFTVVEVVRRYRIDAASQRTIVAPTLRFVHATKFDDDFLRGRVATDPQDVLVRGAPLELSVEALPVEGRPPEFTGAVGRFTLEASVDRPTVAVGGTLRLTLRLAGEGDLPSVEPPRPALAPGFHVYGMLDDHDPVRRTLVFEISPTSAEVTEVPPIPFAFFDRGPLSGYRVVRTDRILLSVTPAANPSGTVGGAHDDRPPSGRSPLVLPLAILGVAVLGSGAWWLAQRRASRIDSAAADPVQARARHAAATFRVQAARADADLGDALAEYLAARLGCSPAAVIAPDLARRLEERRVPPRLAERAASTLESLVAARYAAGGLPPRIESLPALVDELEAAFGRESGSA